MSTENVSPAEEVRQRLEYAKRKALQEIWEEFEKNEALHREELRKLNDRFANWTHGTSSTYSAGCRCDDCRSAWRAYINERNRKKRESNPKPKREPKGRAGRVVKEHMHGTLTGYAYGCRCERCTTAHREARPKASVKKHGSNYAYRHQKCRCRKCVKAESQRVMERRRRKREAMKDDTDTSNKNMNPYPVIETSQPEEPQDIYRPSDLNEEHSQHEDIE